MTREYDITQVLSSHILQISYLNLMDIFKKSIRYLSRISSHQLYPYCLVILQISSISCRDIDFTWVISVIHISVVLQISRTQSCRYQLLSALEPANTRLPDTRLFSLFHAGPTSSPEKKTITKNVLNVKMIKKFFNKIRY